MMRGTYCKSYLNDPHPLCTSRVREILTKTRYRANVFAFRQPGEMIMFMSAIGWINIARMKFDKNLVISSTFFSKHKRTLELKWLVHWHPKLRYTMKGLELITPDWKPESFDDEYKPPGIEKALMTILEVMAKSTQFDATLKKGRTGDNPSRIQTLDMGDSFGSISSRIQSMGLGDAADAGAPQDTMEALEAAGDDGEEHQRSANDWGEWYWDAAAYEPKTDEMIARDEDEDAPSEDSGYYSPALHDDHGKQNRHISGRQSQIRGAGETLFSERAGNRTSIAASASTNEGSNLEQEVMELFEAAGMYFSTLQILLRPVCSPPLINNIGSGK